MARQYDPPPIAVPRLSTTANVGGAELRVADGSVGRWAVSQTEWKAYTDVNASSVPTHFFTIQTSLSLTADAVAPHALPRLFEMVGDDGVSDCQAQRNVARGFVVL
jgi:hypothetical protein